MKPASAENEAIASKTLPRVGDLQLDAAARMRQLPAGVQVGQQVLTDRVAVGQAQGRRVFVGEQGPSAGSSSRNDEQIEQLRKAFLEHSVLVLRGVEFTPEQHVTYSKNFGVTIVHPTASPDKFVPGNPKC